jgi:hypothetical protein
LPRFWQLSELPKRRRPIHVTWGVCRTQAESLIEVLQRFRIAFELHEREAPALISEWFLWLEPHELVLVA